VEVKLERDRKKPAQLEDTMVTPTQPRTEEVLCRNGVVGYIFEDHANRWEIRYCTRVIRGVRRQELPESLLEVRFDSAADARQAIARRYGTTIA
jgi:hypothetical protein